MLESLTTNFSKIVKQLRGQGRLTEENIQTTTAAIRHALLEADVALPIADEFIASVRAEALGAKVTNSLNPGQAFVGIVYNHLVQMMGDANTPLQIKRSPSVVLACGLQGVGKTTNIAKIAKQLKQKQKKRVLLAGVDVHRPAAIEQLSVLANDAGIPCFTSDEMSDAVVRAKQAVRQAQQELMDVVLIDTAGRTTLDDEMMGEIERIFNSVKPSETLFFVDAMQGQDAVNVATQFAQKVDITGIVVTKFDGDSRGGSVLSAKVATGKPIKYVGVGEKPDDLEQFFPDRFASRILGMGDIASLAEQVQEKTDVSTIQKLSKKLQKKPANFDLNDQLLQIQQMKKMGGVKSILDKLPGQMSAKLDAANLDGNEQIKRTEAIILSMTPQERRTPEIIKASRKRRIAKGSATEVSEINQLLQQHDMMKKMMKKHAKNPMAMVRMMKQMLQ